MQPAITFEPDGYLLDGPRLMGRQSAGNGFLRAAANGFAGEPLISRTPRQASHIAFDMAVKAINPAASTAWIPSDRLDLLARVGLLYRPDHALVQEARLRLRAGPAAYSLCGVTHTLASETSLAAIADYPTAALMPWDAVICTSECGRTIIRATLEEQEAYLRWRLGSAPPREILLPVIPLGVHTQDFTPSPELRARARAELGISGNAVVALYAGRMSFSAKAHPWPMYTGLQAAAERTGRTIVLLQAGSFVTPKLEQVFRDAAAAHCPDVRVIFVAGKDAAAYAAVWQAADIFVSLADSIQETFGITPVEAMAAGLPIVVTDWNGYKETVRDGVDGFRIPTWQPAPGAGEAFARSFDAGAVSFDEHMSRASSAVSLDLGVLIERLCDLIGDPDLRARLGQAGLRRARATFDWSVVYSQYQALWAELAEIRTSLSKRPEWIARLAAAPRSAASYPDPFARFAHFSTATVGGHTLVRLAPDANLDRFATLSGEIMFSFWNPPRELVAALLGALGGESRAVAELADPLGLSVSDTTHIVTRLAKMGLLILAQR